MCGITGWVSHERDLTNSHHTLNNMTETMACRGPDASGTWIRRHVGLGHRRLAVIDLPGGVQPMTAQTSEGTIAIVYSGEVYNFGKLRSNLSGRGHRFRTNSDTEVVLRAYLEWGEDVAKHLNGMFAFAIWDERRSKLVLIRDRMGIKPLYYHPTRDGVLFGSEPKAILANSIASRVIDIESLYNLFLDTRAPDRTPWANIYEVQPGAIVVVTASGIRHHTYWTLRTMPHVDDMNTTVDTVRELMTDIVGRQLVADVPQCVLLSGGLDSSAISGLAAAHLSIHSEQLRTFSVQPSSPHGTIDPALADERRDSDYAQDVAGLIGSAHSNVALEANQIADIDVRRAVITARDMPSLGQMDASLYLLFKEVRNESIVALSGESSDEAFGGYHWFHDETVVNARTFPWSAKEQTPLYTPRALAAMLLPEIAGKLDVTARTADQYATAVADIEHVDGTGEFEKRMRTICNLALTRHVRLLLERKDRISMAVGLEVRVPFCDHRLIEYAYNIPWDLKAFDGREKSVLRHATKHVLPRSVISRTKRGFPATTDPSYTTGLQQQARELLAEHDHQVFTLLDRRWLQDATQKDSTNCSPWFSAEINLALDLYHWLEIYRPSLDLSR